MIIPEDIFVGDKADKRPIGFPGRLDILFVRNDGLAIFHLFIFSVAIAGYQEITTQGINGFDADTVQTNRLLKGFAVVFGSGIHLAGDIYNLA